MSTLGNISSHGVRFLFKSNEHTKSSFFNRFVIRDSPIENTFF